jgi:hypothetical protein
VPPHATTLLKLAATVTNITTASLAAFGLPFRGMVYPFPPSFPGDAKTQAAYRLQNFTMS